MFILETRRNSLEIEILLLLSFPNIFRSQTVGPKLIDDDNLIYSAKQKIREREMKAFEAATSRATKSLS